jgi:hypothetical protein
MKLYEMHDLNWATRDNAQRKINFDDKNLVVLNVNIKDVFDNGGRSFRLDLDDELGGRNAIKDRLPRAKEHFKRGGAMDLPEVGYNEATGTIDFTNGRHRTAAAYQMGYEYIPMFVSKDGLDEFKKLVRTK